MPPSMNMAYLETRLSGGASNTDPDASLGGIMSSERVYSQSAAAPTNCTGITIDDGNGNSLGDGTLSFIFSSTTATWKPSGATVGTAVDISVDGRYVLADDTGNERIFITVVNGSLPGSDQSDTDITIANIANETFDTITKRESLDGDIEYRCFYLINVHPTDTVLDATTWIKSDASGADSLSLGADPAGVGDGSTTGVAGTSADEDTAPSPTVTFSEPATQGAGIILGDLDADQAVAFWQRRTVPAVTTVSTAIDLSRIGFSLFI